MLLTTNTLQKTFLIKQGNHTGTAFAVEVEGKQYLATERVSEVGAGDGMLLGVPSGRQQLRRC